MATHNFPEGHPDFTGLMMSRFDEHGRQRNGFVLTREIYDLSFPAELVVLSACGTGLGVHRRGEGPISLSRAFLHAGAKRVVVSLWNVTDKSTASLMKRFYREMFQNKRSPTAALQTAQKAMANDSKWKAPKKWAGFVLYGEPR